MAVLTAGGSAGLNVDKLASGVLLGKPGSFTVQEATKISTLPFEDNTGLQQDLYGTFTYNADGLLTGGTLTRFEERQGAVSNFNVTGVSMPILTFLALAKSGDTAAILDAFFSGADTMTGGAGADVLRGLGGVDTLNGGDGADILEGGAGADILDGGNGTDVARFAGMSRNYGWTLNGNGSWTVTDYRAGAPDGADTLRNIETIRFSDGDLALSNTDNAQVLRTAFDHILRVAPTGGADAAFVSNLVAQVGAGTLTKAAAIGQIMQRADASTAVATLSYQFFTGSTPSGEGLDYLISPTGGNANNLNSAYYQSFNLENRYINFAVNLGKLGAGAQAFTAEYGNLSLFDATSRAYAKIYGSTPTDTKVHALVDPRADYFAYYGQDGANGIGTKAAMVGWLLAEAVKADIGAYATSSTAYFTDLADGAAYAVNMVGVYPGTAFTG